jgi:hypothetical protein
LFCTLLYATAVLAGTMRAAPADPTQPPAESAVGRWYRSLPGWGCAAARFPAAFQVKAPIGPEIDALVGGKSEEAVFTDAPIINDLLRVGAIYDPAHRIALFDEHGTDIGHYLLIADVGAPPAAVKERDLSALAMGGKVHLGDTLDKVRAAFGVPATVHLTTTSGCAFPQAASYSRVIFYGPPHHPPIPSADNLCRDVGQDIKREQTLGYAVFRANRVAVLEWNYGACAY